MERLRIESRFAFESTLGCSYPDCEWRWFFFLSFVALSYWTCVCDMDFEPLWETEKKEHQKEEEPIKCAYWIAVNRSILFCVVRVNGMKT